MITADSFKIRWIAFLCIIRIPDGKRASTTTICFILADLLTSLIHVEYTHTHSIMQIES